jgi:Domain of unknown function (DUF4430)
MSKRHDPEHRPEASAPGTRRWWRLPLMLAIVLAAIALMRGGVRYEKTERHEQAELEPAAAGEPAGQTVSLSVNFGEGTVREFEAVDWREGMTVLDLLAAVGQGNDGVRYAGQGSGKMAFLTELGGVGNEGAGGRNWTYAVDGKRADRSFAVHELRPGDRVLWSFAASE